MNLVYIQPSGKTRGGFRESDYELLIPAIQQIVSNLKYDSITLRGLYYKLISIPEKIPYKRDRILFGSQGNDDYKCLSDLVTKLRVMNLIPMNSIIDETRSVKQFNVWDDSNHFLNYEIDNFMNGYSKNLLSNQPNIHIIICEKRTMNDIINESAGKYTMIYTTGGGNTSLSLRYQIHRQFIKSKKQKIIIYYLSDNDPSGLKMPVSLLNSMIDDFGMNPKQIDVIHVCVTDEQIKRYELNEKKLYNTKMVKNEMIIQYELDAIIDHIQTELESVIDATIDIDLFNQMIDEYNSESEMIDEKRENILGHIRNIWES